MIIERPVLKLRKSAKKDDSPLCIGDQTIEQHLLMANVKQPFFIVDLLSKQDWSIFEAKYPARGRDPYKPQAMVGLILYGLMQGTSSLRDLARMARVDLGCIYITNGLFPDSSSICRFIQRHQEALSDEFFIQLTRMILKLTRSGIRSVAGDGTIIEAAVSRYGLMRQEAIEEQTKKALAEAAAHPEDALLAMSAEKMTHVAKELQARITKREQQRKQTETVSINPLEPDAVVQPTKKGKISVPAYKPSVLANDARVVVAIDVHPSSEVDSLMVMLEKTSKLGDDQNVEELLLDGGYESVKVLEECVKRNINILCTAGKHDKKKVKKI